MMTARAWVMRCVPMPGSCRPEVARRKGFEPLTPRFEVWEYFLQQTIRSNQELLRLLRNTESGPSVTRDPQFLHSKGNHDPSGATRVAASILLPTAEGTQY